MAGVVTITHKFVSQLEDSSDAAAAGELVPSNWNDEHEVVGAAPLDSPAFVNSPTAPTPPPGDASDRLATTAFVEVAISAPARLTILGAGTVTVPDNIAYVVAKNTSPGAFQINVPLSTALVSETITFKDRMLANGAGAGTYNITLATQGSETIDGAATIKLDVDNMELTLRKCRDDAGDITGEGYEVI